MNEEIDDASRHAAMVEFLGTFGTLTTAPPETLADLSDGVVLFEALSEFAPDYFDPTTIARHLGDNWALKASNLRKLVRNLEHYLQDELRKEMDGMDSSVLQQIARNQNARALAGLVELVAAAAVSCEHKADYVQRILSLSPESQVAMKDVIETSMTRLTDYEPSDHVHMEDDDEDDDKELVFGQGAKDDSTSRALFGAGHNEADDNVKEELMQARRQIDSLTAQLASHEQDAERAQQKLSALVQDLQDRLVSRQDELIAVEEDLQRTTTELEDTKSKLVQAESTKTQLADDLDVALAKTQQLHKAEATVVAYKKKLESVGVMNQQMTDLEEQAANYLSQILDLEQQVQTARDVSRQNAELQERVQRLETHESVAANAQEQHATELAEVREQLAAAEAAKKVYEEEVKELRAQQEAHKAMEEQEATSVPTTAADVSFAGASLDAETREKLLRLELENKKLSQQVQTLKSTSTAASVAAVAASSDAATSSEVARLHRELQVKEEEHAKISSDKEKLEAYTKRTLAKFQDKYLVALQECKAKLKEKQDKIEILEQRSASERTAQKREERLLSSTIYELGLAIMQNRLKDR